MVKKALAVTESGIWETIAGCNAPPPPYDSKMMAVASASVGIEVHAQRKGGLISALQSEIVELVTGGLFAKTKDDWYAYWTRDRIVAFERANALLSSAIDSAFESADERRQVIERGNAACISKITTRLGHLVGDIDKAEDRIREACDIIDGCDMLPDPKLRGVDSDCAVRLSMTITWYGIAINSLTVAADRDDVPAFLVEMFTRLVKGGSMLALRTAQYAADLRSLAPSALLVLNAFIQPADDGYGFVGAVEELNIETCGETQEEMRSLLVKTVSGYFRAEKARDGLRETLSMFRVEGASDHLLVSLYVREEGESRFADIFKVSL